MAEGENSKSAVIGLVIGTVAAIGGGFGLGAFFLKQPEAGTAAPSAAQEAKAPARVAKALAPVITNLSSPPDTFVRLQGAIVLDADAPESGDLAAKVSDDIVTYLRTVSLDQIQGPTGFQFLKQDLKKRAIELGGGRIHDFLLTAFVVE